jgi:hypothetical protein
MIYIACHEWKEIQKKAESIVGRTRIIGGCDLAEQQREEEDLKLILAHLELTFEAATIVDAVCCCCVKAAECLRFWQ